MKKILCLIIALILTVASFSAVMVSAAEEVDVDAYVNGLIDGSLSFWDIDYYSLTEDQMEEFDEKLTAYTDTLTEEELEEFTKQIGFGDFEDENDVSYGVLSLLYQVDPEIIKTDMTEIFGTSDMNVIDEIINNVQFPMYISDELMNYFLGNMSEDDLKPDYNGYLNYCKYMANCAATDTGTSYPELLALIYGVSAEQAKTDIVSIFGAVSDEEIDNMIDDYLLDSSLDDYDDIMDQLTDEYGYMTGYDAYITLFQLVKDASTSSSNTDTIINTDTDTSVSVNSSSGKTNVTVDIHTNAKTNVAGNNSGNTTTQKTTSVGISTKNPATGVGGVGVAVAVAAVSLMAVAFTVKKKSK